MRLSSPGVAGMLLLISVLQAPGRPLTRLWQNRRRGCRCTSWSCQEGDAAQTRLRCHALGRETPPFFLWERLCECSPCVRICSSIGTVFFSFFLAARHPADIDSVSYRWCPGTGHVIFDDMASVLLRASTAPQSAALALLSFFTYSV